MRLALLKNGMVQSTFPVSDSDLVMGRDEACDIVLDDRRASKEHARISRLNDRIVVTDLGSSNGTRVNERPVLAQRLRPGDMLRVGRSLFLCLADKTDVPFEEGSPVGWLAGNLPAQGKVGIPIGPNPVLIGGSREATLRILAKDVRDFQMHVVGIPGGIQAANISGEKPRCALLRHGESFRVGSIRLAFHSAAATPGDDAARKPSSSEIEDSRFVDAAEKTEDDHSASHDSGTAVSVVAQQEQLGKALEEEAAYAEAATASRRYRAAPTTFRAGAFQLTAVAGPCSGQVFALTGKRMTIGRGRKCDVYLDDESVSREHATVERVEGDMVIEDLRSSNGVFVNERRIRRHPLKTGDKVRIGMSEFLVHL